MSSQTTTSHVIGALEKRLQALDTDFEETQSEEFGKLRDGVMALHKQLAGLQTKRGIEPAEEHLWRPCMIWP